MIDKEQSAESSKTLKYAILAFAIIFFAGLSWMVGRPLIRFASEPTKFRAWVDGHGLWGKLAYVGMVIVQVIIALIPGEPFEIVAGYAFGAWEGTLLCMLASSIGSILVFFMVQRFGFRAAELFFSREKLHSLRFLQSSRGRDFLFLLIFMIPGTPKDLLCYFAGLTDISFISWLLICSLGRLPSIITSTIGGDALGGKKYWFAAAVFVLTLMISCLGLWIYQIICIRHNQPADGLDEEN